MDDNILFLRSIYLLKGVKNMIVTDNGEVRIFGEKNEIEADVACIIASFKSLLKNEYECTDEMAKNRVLKIVNLGLEETSEIKVDVGNLIEQLLTELN